MQSHHFDASAYQSAIYGPNSGFESGTIKLHHSGYTGEPDAGCYSNYVSPSLQTNPGYSCRDPPVYSETSFFHSAAVMPNFSNANYYKMANRQMDELDYTGSSLMSRQQHNFLLKSPDSLALNLSPNSYEHRCGSSNNANTGVHELHPPHPHQHLHQHQPQHHHHQQQQQQHQHQQQQQQRHHHIHHPASFDEASQSIDAAKLVLENSSPYGHGPVKLEAMKLEPAHSHAEYENSLHTTSSASGIAINTPQETETTRHHSSGNTSSCSHISNRLSPKHIESKHNISQLEKALDTNEKKESTEEKKKEEGVNADCKPTMSYIALIAKAILESEQRRLNLGSIYNWIEKHYPFYKNKGQGWRNSVRHNLSLNDCFIKAGRCEDGKGNYWAIHPANIQDFMRGDFRQRRRSRRRGRKKECDLSMYHVPNGYLQSSGAPLAPSMTFNPAALSSIYSPYTEAERRAYRLDEALLRQSMSNPFVKWYQQGVSSPGTTYGVSTSPPACGTAVYANPTPVQWTQTYTDSNTQTMYPALNSTFPR